MSNHGQHPGQQPNPRGHHRRPPPTPSGAASQPPHPPRPRSHQLQNPATLTTRRSLLSPTFASKLRQLALPLAPLVQLTSGTVHPEFPQTLLNFWLLTDDQLDRLASFYHQRTPCQWTAHYPCPVSWPAGMGIEEKRRRIGRFIGLRGCESPLPTGTSLGLDVDMRQMSTGGKKGDVQVDDAAMENEGNGMSTYISALLKSTIGMTDEDIAETERRVRGAQDELDEIRRKMGWYL
ncbi:hypothetical protein GE21DRAFT_875 [Neurospora crassa]|uniref:Beta-xylosidase n=2 Tax=Neurospora crassa TaxID=5141 RepID=Q7SH47_NEUCR|nr:hypothetical protein NCU02682 [Neurospora crassa OR74A]EAA36219.1 hypothetical protein NCU02682 [Neurospora crassa OR74A]KHE90130.1 hypothetical protein GE21DRAFT_875 [Neurospora crassa]CAE76491.1 putative protein [Neurospora crassa]|eukprot:XP_965455.1 hypothetical protein NCU02682 [Neurospora crassa OR74A]